jgi:PAS domain S-box-containing protein
VVLRHYDNGRGERDEERIRLRAVLLDSLGQAVIATDLEGSIIYWNRAAEDLYGWSAE